MTSVPARGSAPAHARAPANPSAPAHASVLAQVSVPARVSAAVEALRQRPIPVTDKAFGGLAAAGPVSAASLAAGGRSMFGPDFTMPLLVLRESAVRQNIEQMTAYCAAAGVELAPHGKTTMAPQLLARQLAAGAWGITAATIAQVRVYRAFGVPRVLIANQLTDRAGIRWLAGELAADPGFDCYAYVDSRAGVALLDEELRDCGGARPLPVLVELGHDDGRTGCRSTGEALAVGQAAREAGMLRLAGAAGFEGGVGHDGTAAALDAVTRFCAELRRLGQLLATAGAPPDGPLPDGPPGGPILSAGGSAFFDLVIRELTKSEPGQPAPTVILRSGAYVTHDHGYYAALAPSAQAGVQPGPGAPPDAWPGAPPDAWPGAPPDGWPGAPPDGQAGRTGPLLVPALELWAGVLSRPEPGLAILGAGRRDVGFDQGMPVPLLTRRASGATASAARMSVSKLDDQHAYLSLPATSELAPGDLVCLGISHPCTAFDKWRVIPEVDDNYQVVDAIHTFF